MANLNSVSNFEEQTPSDLTEDRISSLPWHVLSIILSFLPILDAVRTSVLAKDWRYRWLSLSEFALDCNAISFGRTTRGRRRWELVSSIINKYLLHHTSPITHFYLRSSCSPHYMDLYQWIQYLSMQDVEVLCLQENCMTFFFVPSPLFFFKKLKRLFLGGCAIRIPSDFEGFKFLHSLLFRDVAVNSGNLNRLIRSCPILEKLTLLNISGFTLLRIHAPRLTVLYVDTGVEDIVIRAAPCLANVIVADIRDRHEVVFNANGVVRSLLGLSTIRELGISGDMIKLLAVDYGVGNFPWMNFYLTSLELNSMSFDTVEVFHVCLTMLSSCPNVHHLYFTFLSAKGPKLIKKFLKENQGRYSFPELISLEMMSPEGVGLGCTVDFLEFISAHSPNLKSLTVAKEGGNAMNQKRVLQMLTRLRRRCPQASVQYVHDGPRNGRITYP